MTIPKDTVLENSFNVTFTVPDHRFDRYTVTACPTDRLVECGNVTKEFDYSVEVQEEHIYVVVNDLQSGTHYNVSVWTALTNSLESETKSNVAWTSKLFSSL